MLIFTIDLIQKCKEAKKGMIFFFCLLFLNSCQDNPISAQDVNTVATESPIKATGIELKTDVLKIQRAIFEREDTINLSFCHGITAAQQITKEQLQFIDLDVFFNVIKQFQRGETVLYPQQYYSERVRGIAATNDNKLEGLIGEQKRQMDVYLSSLYYLLVVKNDAFPSIDLTTFRAGLRASWGKRKNRGVESKMEKYHTYLDNFNVNVGSEFLNKNKNEQDVITTNSGLQYKVLRSDSTNGQSKKYSKGTPESSSEVTVHYHGVLLSGEIFDSSYPKQKPTSFGLSQVIKGWTEGIQLMRVGEKFRFYIPSQLAYGDKGVGPIAPNSVLVFDVELIGFN